MARDGKRPGNPIMVRATISDPLWAWYRMRAISSGVSVQDQTGEAMRAYALANGYTEGENDAQSS